MLETNGLTNSEIDREIYKLTQQNLDKTLTEQVTPTNCCMPNPMSSAHKTDEGDLRKII